MNYHPDLNALKERFQTFIQKLIDKAQELEVDAQASAQIVYDEDEDEHKRSYRQFQLGIEGQFKNIKAKANQVFDDKILPLRQSNSYPNVTEWYGEMYKLKSEFDTQVWAMMKNIFDSVQEVSPEVQLQKILDEYEEIKDAFNCEQCGANLSIDKLYAVSTYITCPYCQTQNTFIPGSRTQALPGLSREIAEERLEALALRVKYLKDDRSNKLEQTKAYNYYRARVWVEKSRILRAFAEEFLKVYYRELHEHLYNYNDKKLDLNPKVYQALLEQFGFVKETMHRIESVNPDKDTIKKILEEWEMLFSLSAYIIPQIYQVGKQEEVYNHNFQRVQNQWKLIADLRKKLVSDDISVEEAVKKIKTEFK